jgi:polysaccharide biosynthesis transport protein
VTSGGAEALKAAIRRSLPLICGLILLGIVAVNVFKAVQGPRYEASARVLISSTPLSSIISGTEPSFVDPQRVQATAIGVASSPRVYEIAAADTEEKLGDADTLRSSVRVTGDPASDLISFTASTEDADDAVAVANAAATGFIDFRDELASEQIETTINGLRSRVETLPAGSAQASELEAQIARLEPLVGNSSDDQLVERASDATQTTPAPIRDSLVGFAIGLIISLLLVALREAVDTTVRSEGQVEEVLAAPVLASVKTMPRRTRLVTYGRHEAAYADAYALLAAQLVSTDRGQQGRVLAVTSAMPEEGKTTTAANLAVSVARRGLRVIIADFDFRKPGISDLFELPHEARGALQVMSGEEDALGDALWSVSLDGASPRVSLNGGVPADELPHPATRRIAAAGTGSLHILPSGGLINTREVPQQSRMRWLVSALCARADLVILDTPPALLTMEVAELSSMIDSILIVVRQGRVSYRNLRALGRQSRSWSAEVTGAVMTDMQTEGEYSYYGGR